MGLEVALLESDPDGGVRILGRTADATVVALVRDHLIERFDQPQPEPRPPATLKLVPSADRPNGLDREAADGPLNGEQLSAHDTCGKEPSDG